MKGGSSGTAEALQKEWDFQLVTDYALFQECKVILLRQTGAKVVLPVLQELAPHFSNESLLISAAGHTIQEAQMAALAIKEAKSCSCHSNTPLA